MSTTTVDHIVLLRVRDSTNLPTLLSSLHSLNSLDVVSHLAAGPLLNHHPQFTHFIHARFASKSHLDAYNNHPQHLAIIHNLNPICDDVLIVDWFADFGHLVVPQPGSVLRVSLVKKKEEFDVEAALGKLTSQAKVQVTKGENFEKTMGKGFEVALLEVFSCVEEMGLVDESVGLIADDVVVVEFGMP